MKMVRVIVAVIAVMLLASCASGAQMAEMVYTSEKPMKFSSKLKGQMSIRKLEGGSKTNPAWASQIGDKEFKGALEESMKKQGLIAKSGGNYKMDVSIVKVDQPMAGLEMDVTMWVRYEINRGGREVFDETIKVTYTAEFFDSLYGPKRLQIANEGAAKKNIQMFLKKLSEAKI